LNVQTARWWRGIVPLAREGRMTVIIGRREQPIIEMEAVLPIVDEE
jgi:hypothetical protein